MTFAARSTSRGWSLAFALCLPLVACGPSTHHVAVGKVSAAKTVASPALPQPTMPLPATVLATAAPSVAVATVAATSAPVPARATASSVAGRAVVRGTHILSIATTPTVVHDGDTVAWDVRTTSDVVDVLAHVTAYSFRFQRQAPGRFRLTFTIPKGVPGFFHGTYHMNVVARANDGATDASTVAVVFE